jgi:hypothetical protein
MHVKEFNIITDYTKTGTIECEDGTIAVANNLSCGVCGDDTEFEPLISDGNNWHCVKCWTDAGHEPPTEGTKMRLNEAKMTTRMNCLIRNM